MGDCRECGQVIDRIDARFCSECGARLVAGPTSDPSHTEPVGGEPVRVLKGPQRRALTGTPILPGFEHWHLLGMSAVLSSFAQCTSNHYLSAGYALRVDGSVVKWETRTALLSDTQQETYEAVRFPTQVVELPGKVVSLIGGGNRGDKYGSVLALTEEGEVWAWGEEFYEDAGIEAIDSERPAQLEELADVVSLIETDDGATRIALTAQGRLWAWGSNYGGALGDGTTTDRAQPSPIDGVSDVVAVRIQPWGVVALDAAGSVWTWGQDPFAGRNDAVTEDRLQPALVDGLPVIVALGGGRAAIDADGGVWIWDKGADARRVDDITGAVDVVYGETNASFGAEYAPGAEPGGTYHALTSDGQVWGWGANDGGQIGNGGVTRVPSPERVHGLDHIIAIVAWDSLRYALAADATVWAWGGVGGQTRISSVGTEVSDLHGATARAVALPSVRDVDGPVKWGSLEVTGLGSEELRQQFWDLREGRSMLMTCSAAGLGDEVELMIAQGAPVNLRDDDGDTALFYAASKGNASIVKMLLEAGADPNLPASDSGTPLVIAASANLSGFTGQPIPHGKTSEDFRSTVITLLRGGADPRPMYDQHIEVVRETGQGMTVIAPEHLSRCLGFDDLSLVLRNPRAQRDAASDHTEIVRGYASIDRAVADQRAFQSRSLQSEFYASMGQWGLHAVTTRAAVMDWLRAGAPINGVAKVDYGDNLEHWETPLLTAFIDGHLEAASALLEFGAEVDAPNAIVFPNGSVLNHTTLHMLAQRGDTTAARQVIAAGADVNRRTSLGTTSLHFAAGEDNYNLVVALLNAGADPHIREFNSDRPGGFGDLPIDQAGPTTTPLLR